MKPARVLTIAGSDSGGGAGIQADLKTITVLGGFGMSVITALTAQNTLGVQGVYEVTPEFVEEQFESVMTDIGVDAAKTGMLANAAVLRVVAENIRRYNIEKLVVDPVMVAKGGTLLIRGEFRETLIRELIPLAFVLTPNIPEAEILAEMPIASVSDMKKAARIIHDFSAKHVVVKGGHLSGNAVDVFYDGKRYEEFVSERIGEEGIHGTGCTFSAAIATGLAKGEGVLDAIANAKAYITEAIRHARHIGGGHRVINHSKTSWKREARLERQHG
jgi:hydroxymethylpyrimidine/phosphomethylpyrimidine kinase